MALIVEDGTGKSDAEAFESVSNADTYHADHGDPSTWSGATPGAKEGALRQATQYLQVVYVHNWKGRRTTREQALDWPRIGVVDPDGWTLDSDAMPLALRQATSILAEKALGETLLADVRNPGSLVRKKTKADVIETDVTYAGGSQHKRFALADALLQRYLEVGGEVARG